MLSKKQDPYGRPGSAIVLRVLLGILVVLIVWHRKGAMALLELTTGWKITEWQFVLGTFFIISSIFWLRSYLTTEYRKRLQKDREAGLAERKSFPKMAGKNEPYFLYLRPFASTGTIQLGDNEANSAAFLGNLVLDSSEDLEIILGKAVAPDKLLALGQRGEAVGADRIEVPEMEWRQRFEKLALRAKGILLLPALRTGTAWEMDYLIKHPELLRKTIFLMPPQADWLKNIIQSKDFDIVTEWDLLHQGAKEEGFDFPAYVKGGMLFTLKPKGGIRNNESPAWTKPSEFRQTIQRLLGHI